MRDMVEIRYEQREFEDLQYLFFKGLLFDEQTGQKYAYLLGHLLGENEVFVSIDKDENCDRYKLKINRDVDLDEISDVPENSVCDQSCEEVCP